MLHHHSTQQDVCMHRNKREFARATSTAPCIQLRSAPRCLLMKDCICHTMAETDWAKMHLQNQHHAHVKQLLTDMHTASRFCRQFKKSRLTHGRRQGTEHERQAVFYCLHTSQPAELGPNKHQLPLRTRFTHAPAGAGAVPIVAAAA